MVGAGSRSEHWGRAALGKRSHPIPGEALGRCRESGAALVLALIAITLILTSVLLLAKLIDARQTASSYEQRNIILATLADAAFAETLAHLSENSTFAGVQERNFPNGRISSRVSPAPSGGKTVVAIGERGRWREVIVARVVLDQGTGRPRVVRVDRSVVLEE